MYHYTCEHGHGSLGAAGTLLPLALLEPDRVGILLHPWHTVAQLSWMTDLEHPERHALGLTSGIISCDRTAHRYRITDTTHVERWLSIRRRYAADMRDALESTPGAMPAHWYVSARPVPVVYDPITDTVRRNGAP